MFTQNLVLKNQEMHPSALHKIAGRRVPTILQPKKHISTRKQNTLVTSSNLQVVQTSDNTQRSIGLSRVALNLNLDMI